MPDRRTFLTAAAGGGMLARATLPESFEGIRPGVERTIAGIRFCWCPPGRFVMGSPPGEPGHRPDEAQVEVTLTRGFWMAKFEVTQSQWRGVTNARADRPPTPEFGEGDDVPIYWVTFTAAESFCREKAQEARRAAALPASWEIRLPTEAQWEYAARAGTVTATSFGDTLSHHQANFQGEPLNGGRGGTPLRRAASVGTFPANAWGICDMHGNVFEWCRDWYHSRLPGGVDPDLYDRKGLPNRDGTFSRVRRGGAWNDDGSMCRSAFRLRYEPARSSDHVGFRVVAVQT